MRESRDRLNDVLRGLGYDVRGDLVIVRPIRNETLEVRRLEHALVIGISTDIGPEFRCDGIRIERFRKNPVVLWVHDYDGRCIARSLWERTRSGDSEDDARRLIAKVQFHLNTELSREVWALINDAAEFKWELGVVPAEWYFDGGARVTKWDLVEISAVPSEECIGRIRQRIKDQRISSQAMLRSVAAEPEKPEPTLTEDEFDESVGPYRYDWERGPHGSVTWTVYGPGFERKVDGRGDANVRVDELNAAWRCGRESAAEGRAPTRPEAPEEDNIEARLSALEERVGEVADDVADINRRLRSAAVRLRNPPVMRRWGDGPEEEEAGG